MPLQTKLICTPHQHGLSQPHNLQAIKNPPTLMQSERVLLSAMILLDVFIQLAAGVTLIHHF